MELGFVGLGNMGGPMALNLLNAGHRLHVYDISTVAVQRVVRAGASEVGTPRAAAEFGQMVLTSLPTPKAVESVYLGAGGLLEGARRGQIFVDLSSIGPSMARELASRFADKGATVTDAPVSGGTTGARRGTLAVMVGGDVEAFHQAEPILKSIGNNVFHVGPVGTSSTIKILNQLLVGINNIAVAEMLTLARLAGLDLALVKEIIGVSAGNSRVFEIEFPKAAARDFAPGFAIDLMAKDLRLVRSTAEELGAELPLSLAALSIFERAAESGLGGQDVSAAIQLYEEG